MTKNVGRVLLDAPGRSVRTGPTMLINRFTGTRPPCEPIQRTPQAEHQCAVLSGHARRTRRDADLVADLQRLALDALCAELRGAGPFDCPALQLAMLVGCLHVHER